MAKDLNSVNNVIFICNGGSCLKKGAEENTDLLRLTIKENNIHEQIHTIKTRCCGQCEHGPVVFVHPDNIWYKAVDKDMSREIVTRHIIDKEILSDHILYSFPPAVAKAPTVRSLIQRFRKAFSRLSLGLLFTCFFLSSAFSQDLQITGTVKDEETQMPLQHASVYLKNTDKATVTNEQGSFTFENIAPGDYTIRVFYLGYKEFLKKVRVKAGENEIVNIILKPDALSLSEVVVKTATTRQGESKLDMMAMQLQPINSAQDLLRSVPGLFIAQHAGGGKAEQIFVRGNDNDHGTDFAVFWDGIPVNMPTHAHGQGYADMHFIIPETVGSAGFFKGPYEAKLGDFSISGATTFGSKYKLERNTLKLERGLFNNQRYLAMLNLLDRKHLVKKWNDNAYVASDYTYSDGFFQNKLNFKRYNIFGRYNAQLTKNTSLIFTASTFISSWNASGQLPLRAIEAGILSRYGSLDNSEGGSTSRTNFNLKTVTSLSGKSFFTNQLYYSKNIFNLFSNFTFFLTDSINGDEIKQWEKRNLFGYKGSYERRDSIGKTLLRSEAGLITRTDVLTRGRDHVKRREFLSRDALNDVNITNISFYLDENWSFHPRWTLNLGVRNELFRFWLKDRIDAENSGKKWVYRFNPKLNLYYDVTTNVTLFAKSGIGFHSNFAQAVISKDATANPVPQSYGADLGSNFKAGKRMVVSVAAWWLRVGAEYKFVSDDGSYEEIGNSRKLGTDLSVRYQITSFLWADMNLNYAKGILIGAPKSANLLILHPRWNSTGGITYRLKNGLNGALRYRYMGARPATPDGSVKAKPYFIMDVVVRYTRPKYEVGCSVENLFDRKWSEAQFYGQSRMKDERMGVEDFHITPGTPFYIKGFVSYFF